MVLSIACAEGRPGECGEWFRCDHPYHRRQGYAPPSLNALRAAAERQFGGEG